MSAYNNVGRHIGNYRVVSEVSSGTFGSVYLAQHLFLKNRTVAIKLLLTAYLNSAEERERFLQEAQFLEMLKHPYILPVIDVGISEGFPYFVAEYASNGSLRTRLKQRSPLPLSLEEASTILLQVGEALHFAHQQHVIHRDLKPENILFNAKGEALLVDFGIATTLSSASIKYVNNMGTPRYMAPEQFRGMVSKESDQYALSCIAYELFTGKPPFETSDFYALAYLHASEPPIPPTQLNPELPQHIEQAVLKALAKQRTDRFADTKAFITAILAPPPYQTLLSLPLQEKGEENSVGVAEEVTYVVRNQEPDLNNKELASSHVDDKDSPYLSTNISVKQEEKTTVILPTTKTEKVTTQPSGITSSISRPQRKHIQQQHLRFFLTIATIVLLASSAASVFLFMPRTHPVTQKITSKALPSQAVKR